MLLRDILPSLMLFLKRSEGLGSMVTDREKQTNKEEKKKDKQEQSSTNTRPVFQQYIYKFEHLQHASQHQNSQNGCQFQDRTREVLIINKKVYIIQKYAQTDDS